ncbi:hypothetical protein B0H34DRAFT_709761 [Crassisporium funariophilum]|nr:hypothetical protein B0H34DRAFT_709761 [Crassisporium funariophilum]
MSVEHPMAKTESAEPILMQASTTLLTLAFYQNKPGKAKKWFYATLFLPETYDDTKTAALKLFKNQLSNTEATITDLNLRCTLQNREGEWVWAEMIPAEWRALVISMKETNPRFEVRVMEIKKNKEHERRLATCMQ